MGSRRKKIQGELINGQCVVCISVVCYCADYSNDNEICWWLGTAASGVSDYPGIHRWEDARGMVEMKTNELIKRINQNRRMFAEFDDGTISICDDAGKLLLEIPSEATNWLEIYGMINNFYDCFEKRSREYLSALIDEYLQTPLEERFPRYRIRLHGFRSDNGKQYLTTDDIKNVFACAWNPSLKQTFTMDEIYEIKNCSQFKSVIWFDELIRNGLEEV